MFRLFCVIVAVASIPVTSWAVEEPAVDHLEKLGAKLTRDDTLSDKPVVEVNFHLVKITDADLKVLGDLKHLHTLSLSTTKVTDGGMKHLRDL